MRADWHPRLATASRIRLAGSLILALVAWTGPADGQEAADADRKEPFRQQAGDILSRLGAQSKQQEGLDALAALCRDAPLEEPQWRNLFQRITTYIREEETRARFLEITASFLARIERTEEDPAVRTNLQALVRESRAAALKRAHDFAGAADEFRLLLSICREARRPAFLAEAVKTYLFADRPDQAQAVLETEWEKPTVDQQTRRAFTALITLYRGDTTGAQTIYGDNPPSALVDEHANVLLDTGRYREAEWLARRVHNPGANTRILLARACFEQGNMEMAASELHACVRERNTTERQLRTATSLLRQIHAAQLNLDRQIGRVRAELTCLALNDAATRRGLLHLLWNLEEENKQFADALHHQFQEMDSTAFQWRYRPPTFPRTLWEQAARQLDAAGRYRELARLAELTASIFPAQRHGTDTVAIRCAIKLDLPEKTEILTSQLADAAAQSAQKARWILQRLPADTDTAPIKKRIAEALPGALRTDMELDRICRVNIAYGLAADGQNRAAADTFADIEATYDENQHILREYQLRYWTYRALDLAEAPDGLLMALLETNTTACRRLAAEMMRSRLGKDAPADLIDQLQTANTPTRDILHELADAMKHHRLQGNDSALSADDLLRLWDQIAPFASPAQVVMDPYRKDLAWIRLAEAFPVRVHLRGGFVECFEADVRALVGHIAKCTDIACTNGILFLATDRGLLMYRPKEGAWSRLHIPECPPDVRIQALTGTPEALFVHPENQPDSHPRAFDPQRWQWLRQP